MIEAQHPPVDAPLNDAPNNALPAQFLHDLRTPLNQILGYSEMLAEQAEDEGQSGLVPDLQKIHSAGRQLLALLNNGAPSHTATPSHAEIPSHADVPSLSDGVRQDRRRSPAATSPAPQMESPHESQTSAHREQSLPDAQALILVVDDIEANRDVLSRRLERQNYNVAMAENGREAMEAVRARAFDLVLLDIMMPEVDGYQVLQQLKADETLRHIPVIMISALDELDSVVRCIEMGAEDYLPKPFNPVLLKARIGASLEKKRAHDREMQLFQQVQDNFKRLQELEKVRDDLTHMIVHDLRTPLTSVISGMQTLDVAGDLNGMQHEIMEISLRGGETLLGMINDLLDVEKMESGSMQLDLTVLDATDLINAAAGQVAALAERDNLALVRRIAVGVPAFRGDEDKLRRVLVNLLGNAIKFTPPDGTVTLEARRGEDGQSLEFSVSDTGEGVPPEAFGRIFEKFGQVESRKAGRVMSTGLGLTFCKLAVEAHGGHIAVESTPGQGSTFTFTIPLG